VRGRIGGEPPLDEAALKWRVIIHLTFVTSGVLLALMDLVSSRSLRHCRTITSATR
jgi:uncharacterized membrane protein YqhA